MYGKQWLAVLFTVAVAGCNADGHGTGAGGNGGGGNGGGNGDGGNGGGGGDSCLLLDPATGMCIIEDGSGDDGCLVRDPTTGECLVEDGGEGCLLIDPVTGACLVEGGDDDCLLRNPATGDCVIGGDDGEGDTGGDCLVRDAVTGICVVGPDTGLPNHVCTAAAPAGSTVSSAESGLLCGVSDEICRVSNLQNVIDRRFNTFAVMEYVVGAADPLLGGSISLTVDLPEAVAAGNVAAFMVEFPGGVLDASLLRSLRVTTALDDTPQEETFFDTVLDVDVLGIVPGSGRVLVGYRNELPYNRLTLGVDAVLLTADITDAVYAIEACTQAVPVATP